MEHSPTHCWACHEDIEELQRQEAIRQYVQAALRWGIPVALTCIGIAVVVVLA